MTSLKIKYGADVRRATLPRVPSYEELSRLVRETYSMSGDFVIKYEDEEFDLVTVASDVEVQQAAAYAGRTSGVLRFEVFDTGNTEAMRISRSLTLTKSMVMIDAPPLSNSTSLTSSAPFNNFNLSQLFDIEALKRLFCNFDIEDFLTRLKAIGFISASEEQLNQFVRTLESVIAESTAVLKHSSTRIQQEEAVHEGIFCDGCQAKIIGVRYKCAFCFNYDLCSRCEASGLHDISHPRVKMVKPVDGVMEQCAWSNQQCTTRFNAQLVKSSGSDCINVAPGRSFVKTFKIRNNGTRSWPSHCTLSFVDGSSFNAVEDVPIFTSVNADQEIDISVEMASPSAPGRYQCCWCLKTPEGNYFGEKMWCDIVVLPPTPTLPAFIADGPARLMEHQLKTFQLNKEDTLVNAQGTSNHAPVPKEAEKESLKVLQDMGFTGDLLTIFRKHRGDIAETITELIVE